MQTWQKSSPRWIYSHWPYSMVSRKRRASAGKKNVIRHGCLIAFETGWRLILCDTWAYCDIFLFHGVRKEGTNELCLWDNALCAGSKTTQSFHQQGEECSDLSNFIMSFLLKEYCLSFHYLLPTADARPFDCWLYMYYCSLLLKGSRSILEIWLPWLYPDQLSVLVHSWSKQRHDINQVFINATPWYCEHGTALLARKLSTDSCKILQSFCLIFLFYVI